MDFTQTSIDAIKLLLSFDPQLWQIVSVSFYVSVAAISIVILPALLCAFILTYCNFYSKKFIITIITTLQAIPTVVIGLLLYMLLSRSGYWGDLGLLFTQKAMILGQMLVCFPVLLSMMHASLQASDKRALETSLTLGASLPRIFMTLIWEFRFPLSAAIIAGFSRIITEVGCSMMVGGNIMGLTRNIPTAIALETSKGAFAQGVALGMILLFLSLVLNFLLTNMKGKEYFKT